MNLEEKQFYVLLMTELIFHRKECGFTQVDMAIFLGITRPQIANIESTRSRILGHQIYLWCKNCNVDIKDVWDNLLTQENGQ